MNDFLLEQLCHPEEETVAPVTDKALKTMLWELLESASSEDESGCLMFHRLLHALNKKRLATDSCYSPWQEQQVRNVCIYLETQWLEIERRKVAPWLQEIPTEPEAFVAWFADLEQTGPGQGHPLFVYLGERASWEEFHYFFQQEYSAEAGFDDLVALTQVKTSPRVKMEMAQNYWDEMGRGNAIGVHGYLLQGVSDHFGLSTDDGCGHVHWAPLALSNLMIALASNRSFFSHSVGALGAVELTAPGRCVNVIRGLKRLGVSAEEYHYYTLHASLDRKHWAGWRDNVILLLVQDHPESARDIAEGALLRLHAGMRCFDVYSKHLMTDLHCPPLLSEVS